MRLLYIALAVAVVGALPISKARADDPCTGAIDGATCPDDGVPCTVDRCASGVCTHVDVPNRTTCDPVADAYRQALDLRALVAELAARVSTATVPDTARVLIDDALASTTSDLARSSEVLAGRITIPPPAAGETLAQARARAAFGIARAAPPRLRSVTLMLDVEVVRATAGPAIVDLARRTHFLYRGTNQLKRELRRLQRVSGVFSR